MSSFEKSLVLNREKNMALMKKQCDESPFAMLVATGKPILGSDYALSITVERARCAVQLSGAKAVKGTVWCELILAAMLTEVANNIPCELGESGIASCAKMIVNKFWHFTIDEIALILLNGMQGKYSRDAKMYHKFTFALFGEWALCYQRTEQQDYLDGQHSFNPEPSSDERSGLTPIQDILARRRI